MVSLVSRVGRDEIDRGRKNVRDVVHCAAFAWSAARLLSRAVKPQPTAARRINPVIIGDTSPNETTAPMTDATAATADSFQE